MWAHLAIFKESLESDDVFVFQEIYIFFKQSTYFMGHKAPHWFPSSSLCFDGWPSDNMVTLKLSVYDYSTKKNTTNLAALPPRSAILTSFLLISVSGLRSGVTYQIKPLPSNLISCARKLILHVDGMANWAANVSRSVNWIKNSLLLLNTWKKHGGVRRGKLSKWSRSKIKHKRHRRNIVVVFHLSTFLLVWKVAFFAQGTIVLFHSGKPGVEVTSFFSKGIYFLSSCMP